MIVRVGVFLSIGMLVGLYTASANAVELRLGQGEFSLDTQMQPLAGINSTIDVRTITLNEAHRPIRNTKWNYSWQADYFESGTSERVVELVLPPATTSLPVPSDYHVHGFNADVGIGYDVVSTERSRLGIGINGGASAPMINIQNPSSGINVVDETLDLADTEIITYKIGVAVQGEYEVVSGISIDAKATLNHQKVEIENKLLSSNSEVDGQYQSYQIGIKLKPGQLLQQAALKNSFLTIGYQRSKWDYESGAVATSIAGVSTPNNDDNVSFQHTNTYLGVGYDF